MRTVTGILLILVLGAFAALLWGLAYFKGDPRALMAAIRTGSLPELALGAPDWEFDLPEGMTREQQEAEPPSPIAIAFARTGPIGEGQSAKGLAVVRARADGARVVLRERMAVEVTPPPGYRLESGFAPLDGGGAMGLLMPVGGDAEPMLFVLQEADKHRRADLTEKMRYYEGAARQMRQMGSFGNNPRLAVGDVGHDARGITFCLEDRFSDERMQAGMRLTLGIVVMVTLDIGCRGFDRDASARLEAVLSGIRPAG